jgi:hypothetical protein
MKQDWGKGGAGPSASQRRWTSTARKEVNRGVRYATVLASPFDFGIHNLILNHLTQKDVIARSYPDTSPIYFYHRGKPFFECVHTSPYVRNILEILILLLSFAQVY